MEHYATSRLARLNVTLVLSTSETKYAVQIDLVDLGLYALWLRFFKDSIENIV